MPISSVPKGLITANKTDANTIFLKKWRFIMKQNPRYTIRLKKSHRTVTGVIIFKEKIKLNIVVHICNLNMEGS